MKKDLLNILVALSFLFLLILMVIFPSESYKAAKNGLNIWFNTVLPSLLPFFIGTELLIGLGVVNFIGVLLEPIMYPVFRVPGAGSFAYAMSITSGYPIGAKITSELRNKNICSKEEGQRLLAFCSTSGPLFMIGAVAVGMFYNPSLGWIIVISHYLGSIIIGLCFRNYRRTRKPSIHRTKTQNPFAALVNARKKDGRKFGILLGDAVKNSFQSLLTIGGFIIFFSVLINLLSITKVLGIFAIILDPIFSVFNISSESIRGFLSGILEITNGINTISLSTDSLITKGVLVSFIIGWGGFSIHAQAISFISKTDLTISPYLIAKVFHGIFSSIFFYIIIRLPFLDLQSIATSVFYNNSMLFSQLSWFNKFRMSTNFYVDILLILIIISCFLFTIMKIRNKLITRH